MTRWFCIALLAFCFMARAEPFLFEKIDRPVSTGKALNYVVTSALLGGTITAMALPPDYYNSPLTYIAGIAAGTVLGGLLGYPRKFVLTNRSEKIVFPIVHAFMGTLALGLSGYLVGAIFFDEPKGYEVPTTGILLGGLGGLAGGIGGGVIGYTLAIRF